MGRSAAAIFAAFGLALWAPPAFAADCVLNQFADLPITMAGLRPMVPAKINDTEVNFIVDSGAFFSTITPEAAAALKLKLEDTGPYFMTKGLGGLVHPSFTTVKSLTLLGTQIPNVQFLVSGEIENGATGMLGQNVLRIADTEYDLAHGAIRLIEPKGCKGGAVAYWAGDQGYMQMNIEGTEPSSPQTIGSVSINGVSLRAVFDTGATSIISVRGAARAGIKIDSPDVESIGIQAAGFGRRPFKTWIARFALIKIGDEEIHNSKLAVADADFGDVDMLIGVDFFLAHRIFVATDQHKLYFTYNGGPIFDRTQRTLLQDPSSQTAKLSTPKVDDGKEPVDADGFSRRGAARAALGDFEKAIADFTRACELAPANADYIYQRAMARLAEGQSTLAMSDLDQSLKLRPDDIKALVTRAELRLATKDKPGATADLDAAARLAAKDAAIHIELAGLYERVDRLVQAIDQYDLWISSHPDSGDMVKALNGRCWVRALAGQDLDKALKDCDRAVRISPNTSSILDSRGLVRLRRGELDKAVADYDAALAIQPKQAWSLYGRGLANLQLGRKAEGEADIAAAVVLRPGLPDEAKAYGIAPNGP